MIKYYYKNAKGKITSASRNREGSTLYLLKPSNEELRTIAKRYKLDLDILTDALDTFEVPRLDEDKGTLYLFVRYATTDEEVISTNLVLIIYRKDLLIFIANDGARGMIREALEQNKTDIPLDTIWSFLDLVNSGYEKTMLKINKKINEVKRNLASSHDISNKTFIELVRFEDQLSDFLAALNPTNTLLHKLGNKKIAPIFDIEEDEIEDIYLENLQLIEICIASQRTITNIREAYSTINTNNLNRLLKFFTSISIILTVPTILSSIYGMNVDLPLSHRPDAFLMVIAIQVIITLGFIAIFVRNRWL
ncbi:magnesium transporter CorA family protein [Candidatus Saccharibacteria bacterium]|nr:magnesium transporter CorA family protein [Candidatus Saccharibacteria bacterium]MCB9834490.1 magnesium transporter CorA family protein [Candidatus Nomurabacteria bacterium]